MIKTTQTLMYLYIHIYKEIYWHMFTYNPILYHSLLSKF